ncbi:PREDICTED: uncharacterized protein LOC105566579 isoform X2 [Vollenhovia emeryi]|uniref:uncharacterized protein LOC105566579 isoform X2 n=1 Tax=Vollenhovia emeryi TaxID=411798 RepID=UPI0005F489A2|nr:PREDICTED: uncharacterized protein LOC105566579 isoform X2 [Vollenhovia emeryi]
MDSAATLVLFGLLIAFAGDAAASCRKMANEEMLEYFCEGGQPADLATVPETTEKLRIIRMPLGRITADTFARFGRNLWVLSCSHCEITDIDADGFRRLASLQQLSLDSNRLTTVRASWFEGLNYLTYLDLNYNDIRDIEDGVYKNLPSLVDLRVSGNRLRCLNLDEMSRLRELKRMFLSENSDFACPHAVSKFLENQGVAFEQDPEWRRLASDTIDVHVPPSVQEGRETVPAHRERLHPDRRPPPEESEVPYGTRDRMFHPDHAEAHRPRHRKPTTTTTVRPKQEEFPVPRVEPRFPDAQPPHAPSESSHQVVSYPYPTPETPPPEDIRLSRIDESSRAEHTLTYPSYPTRETTPHWSYPTRETTPHWSYPTPERSRVPPVTSLSEDTRVAGTDRPPQAERMLTYPPYIPTRETMPYPSYPTSERSRVSGPSDDETTGESGRLPSQAGNTVTYPLYVTTSGGLERTPHGSIQVTRPSSGNSDMVTLGTWSTDDSVEADPSWTRERHGQSRRPPAGGDDDKAMWSTRTPYYGQDPSKMIVEDSSSETGDDLFVATDRSRTTTTPDLHYVRPSPPELIYPLSTDEFYQAPYYESTVTVHPPLQNYQEGGVRPIETTTDKPLPECPENSAPNARPAAALLTLVVVAVLGRAVGERF